MEKSQHWKRGGKKTLTDWKRKNRKGAAAMKGLPEIGGRRGGRRGKGEGATPLTNQVVNSLFNSRVILPLVIQWSKESQGPFRTIFQTF